VLPCNFALCTDMLHARRSPAGLPRPSQWGISCYILFTVRNGRSVCRHYNSAGVTPRSRCIPVVVNVNACRKCMWHLEAITGFSSIGLAFFHGSMFALSCAFNNMIISSAHNLTVICGCSLLPGQAALHRKRTAWCSYLALAQIDENSDQNRW
jgi:hypothetical protein